MGIIITKFKKKKSTEEMLEKLEDEIKCIETYGKDTEQSQRKIVGGFLFTSIIVYLGTALLFYFYFFPATIYDRILYIVPLLLAPIMIVFLKMGLSFYYNRRITKNQNKLRKLNAEKKKILEKVMETETYKVAKKILEKYAPEQVRKNPTVPSLEITRTPLQSNALTPTSSTGLRQRVIAPNPQLPKPASMAAIYQTPRINTITHTSMIQQNPDGTTSQALVPVGAAGYPISPLPRSILPRERSVFDKVVEYLVGDGPSNRYALICKQCSSHNGMALKEEFEYLSFKCCYCFTFNPARKQRPAAPKLESELLPPYSLNALPAPVDTDTSESEKNSASGSEDEQEKSIKDEDDSGRAVEDEEITEISEPIETEGDESEWKTETESVVAES
ncbi:endoplasmic reticulum junction formation protein lunapark isoform X2 [Onthophagus taurus]|uniref:endoplasmic reticulum junction formation protein lunapark isoform X2 n=1 Tax=Onthophagus taurus TaxID=166361 RepID=UPI000C20ED1A|nr:protein lunapark isoform X2 [Onthophagus taurus]